MKNKFTLLLGPVVLFVGCSLHDTRYLQDGDGSGGAGHVGIDSAGSPASAGADDAVGGSAEAGSAPGGSAPGGSAQGGHQSAAGSATTGGSGLAGTGATGLCGGDQVKCESSDLITDFESNDGHLCLMGSGTVISYGDGTGTQSPKIGDVKSYDPSDDCDRGSAYALHALGGGSTDYGFGIAFRFPQNINAVKAGYKGVKFKAKAGVARKISVKVAIPATLDASFGGSCVPTTSPMKLCNDHPAAAVVVAAGGWLDYEVEFASLKQEGWGVAADPNFSAIAQLHFVFPGPVSGGSADFDIWLDDIAFYK